MPQGIGHQAKPKDTVYWYGYMELLGHQIGEMQGSWIISLKRELQRRPESDRPSLESCLGKISGITVLESSSRAIAIQCSEDTLIRVQERVSDIATVRPYVGMTLLQS